MIPEEPQTANEARNDAMNWVHPVAVALEAAGLDYLPWCTGGSIVLMVPVPGAVIDRGQYHLVIGHDPEGSGTGLSAGLEQGDHQCPDDTVDGIVTWIKAELENPEHLITLLREELDYVLLGEEEVD